MLLARQHDPVRVAVRADDNGAACLVRSPAQNSLSGTSSPPEGKGCAFCNSGHLPVIYELRRELFQVHCRKPASAGTILLPDRKAVVIQGANCLA